VTNLLRRAAREPLVIFPVLVLAAAAVLVLLNLNGSSVGFLGVSPNTDPNLLHGHPWGIRSDEAALSTPALVGNTRRGLPTTPWIGLTPTFLPATSTAPSDHWTELFKPQDWGFFVLGASRGFAWHWWSQIAIAMLGTFALLVAVTRRRWTAAALAAVAAFSPYIAWWSLIPGLVLGFAAGATALALAAFRARTTSHAVVLAAAGGYLATAAVLLLYPPWQISLGWVLLAVLAGTVLDHRVPVRRVLAVAGSAGLVMAVACGAWYLQSRDALIATADTIYPGHRVAAAAGGNVAWLFDQPSSAFAAAAPPRALRGASLAANGHVVLANQSEISSAWLPLPILVAVVLAVLVTLLRRRQAAGQPAPPAEPGHGEDETSAVAAEGAPPLLWTTVCVAASGALLLAWTVLPLPGWVGQLTLLNRVEGVRTSLALGLVAVLLLAIGSTTLRDVRLSAPWTVLWVAAAATTVWLSVWATDALPWGSTGAPHLKRLLLVAGFFAVAFALVASGKLLRISTVALVLASAATWVVVNPVYRGLGPLTDDPIVRAMEPLAAGPTPARVAVFGSLTLDALVQSSGVVTLSGLTVYPDVNVWHALAPDQQDAWNNYNKYTWVADATADPALIVSSGSTNRILRINPCAPATLALHLDWVVSDSDLSSFSCLHLADTIKRGSAVVYRYRVVAS
jgi:hypothetical protein